MISIKIFNNDLCNGTYKLINKNSMGSEGRVYKYTNSSFNYDVAMKIFIPKTVDDKFLKNKINKLKVLNEKSIPGIIPIIGYVYNEFDNIIGYIMKLIDHQKGIEGFFRLENSRQEFTLSTVIDYLIRLEQILYNAHENGVIILDIRGRNILIDEKDSIYITDADNFQVDHMKADLLPYIVRYYKKYVSNRIDSNTDKYIYGLYALGLLIGDSNFISNLNLNYKNEKSFSEYINVVVNSLSVPNDIREKFKHLFFSSGNKEYIGLYLFKLMSDEIIVKRKTYI